RGRSRRRPGVPGGDRPGLRRRARGAARLPDRVGAGDMRFVDEFRDADKAHALAARIAALCEPGRQYKLMEVCGGHTHTICNHVTIIPAIKAILDSPDLRLDGFIGPGHVSTVIGCRPYEFIAKSYGKPVVVAGFEPLDILQSIYMLMLQLREGRSEVENQYSRVVPWNGNPVALKAIGETMELRPYFEWRGLGFISHSALKVRDGYAAFDAERLFEVPGVRVADPKACQCGEVLKGVLKPWECKVFGTA